MIDLKAFLGAMVKIGYDGPVVCEPFSQELRAMPAEQALSTVAAAMKRQWRCSIRLSHKTSAPSRGRFRESLQAQWACNGTMNSVGRVSSQLAALGASIGRRAETDAPYQGSWKTDVPVIGEFSL